MGIGNKNEYHITRNNWIIRGSMERSLLNGNEKVCNWIDRSHLLLKFCPLDCASVSLFVWVFVFVKQIQQRNSIAIYYLCEKKRVRLSAGRGVVCRGNCGADLSDWSLFFFVTDVVFLMAIINRCFQLSVWLAWRICLLCLECEMAFNCLKTA